MPYPLVNSGEIAHVENVVKFFWRAHHLLYYTFIESHGGRGQLREHRLHSITPTSFAVWFSFLSQQKQLSYDCGQRDAK